LPPCYDASALAIEQFWRRVARQNFPDEHLRDQKRTIRRRVLDSKTSEGQARLTKVFLDSLHRHGTACFSTNPTSMLMWSYYAEGHSGIVVRFNMALENLAAIPRQFIPVEVRYQDDWPDVNYYTSSTTQFIATILGTKSSAWKHEEEWRLVLVGTSGYVRLPAAIIDGIILGMRIDSVAEKAVRGWIEKRLPTVEVLRVVHRPRSFELQLVPA
jgi:hypothetical protein